MQKISFDSFSNTGFEKLVRTLSLKEFGTAGVVFPTGPDGARDFTFDGNIKPYEAQGWNGYLVLQAKFKEKIGTNAQNVSWLKSQLKAEFKKFNSTKTNLKKPEYYIIASNIPLTGADGSSEGKTRKGGYTKIQEELQSLASNLGIKGFDIWPADKIEELLKIHNEIRRSYSAWITPGDVLADLIDSSQDKKDFVKALKRSIKTSIRRDQYVRLRDAGNVSDANIKASQVFVDLPINTNSEVQGRQHTFIEKIIEISKNNFTPLLNNTEKENNKFVLLGGPGQGKSTASSFLAQAFRANILKDIPSSEIESETRNIIPEILNRTFIDPEKNSMPKRYPAWVSLPRFADKISDARDSGNTPPSLLSFISEEISITSDSNVGKENLRELLSSLPWILILDGLDEVPPSGERDAILEAIQNFSIEEAELKADIVTIITSRPQGYNSDLNASVWTHWQLSSLPPKTAMEYAKLLSVAYYRDDVDRQNSILKQLNSAIKSPITQRLMTSPLQITILLLIVDTGGGVPSSRWTLFNEYFETLKKREKSKGGATQRVIDKNINHIGPIHQRAGLVLQADAETAGGAVSAIETGRFESLLNRYILAQGYNIDSANDITKDLIDLSLHRLVLLSSREEGRISFDVRSLQEYMAAAELTSAPVDVVEKRLELISGKSHWQHVFNIAASRCFSEDGLPFMRGNIINIPRQLESKAEHKIAGNGARLALDMFCDGIAATHPNSRRLLVKHSLELLEMGINDYDNRLVNLYEQETSKLLFEEIRKYTRRKENPISAAAWKLVVELVKSGNLEAKSFLDKEWPKDESSLVSLLTHGVIPICSQEKIDAFQELIYKIPLTSMLRSSTEILKSLHDTSGEEYSDLSEHARSRLVVITQMRDRRSEAIILPKSDNPFKFRFNKLKGLSIIELPDHLNSPHPEWEALRYARDFSINPSSKSLATALLNIKKLELDESSLLGITETTPWPLTNAIHLSVRSKIDLEEISNSVLENGYGDVDDWLNAEHKWLESGVSISDLSHSSQNNWFHKDIGQIGCPAIVSLSMTHGSSDCLGIVLALCKLSEDCKSAEAAQVILGALTFACIGIKSDEVIPDEWTDRIINQTNKSSEPYIGLETLSALNESAWSRENIDTLLSLSSRASIRYKNPLSWGRKSKGPKAQIIASKIVLSTKNRPLLVILSMILVLQKSEKDYILKSINSLTLEIQPDDTQQMRLAINIFRLLLKKIDIPAFCEFIASEVNADNFVGFNLLTLLLDVDIFSEDEVLKIAVGLHESIDEKFTNHKSTISKSIKKLLDVQNSKISDFEIWHEQMKLPEELYPSLTIKKQPQTE